MSLSLLEPIDPYKTGLAIHYCSPLPASETDSGADRATTGQDFTKRLAVAGASCPPGVQVPLRREEGYFNTDGSGRDSAVFEFRDGEAARKTRKQVTYVCQFFETLPAKVSFAMLGWYLVNIHVHMVTPLLV